MTEEGPAEVTPAPTPQRPPLALVLVAAVLVGVVLDLFCLLLLPFRLGGHLVPAGPLLVLVGNAALATAANRLSGDRRPAQLLLGVAIVLSAAAASRGPGGDLLVTRDLQGMYLLFVITACVGAAIPLLRRARSA